MVPVVIIGAVAVIKSAGGQIDKSQRAVPFYTAAQGLKTVIFGAAQCNAQIKKRQLRFGGNKGSVEIIFGGKIIRSRFHGGHGNAYVKTRERHAAARVKIGQAHHGGHVAVIIGQRAQAEIIMEIAVHARKGGHGRTQSKQYGGKYFFHKKSLLINLVTYHIIEKENAPRKKPRYLFFRRPVYGKSFGRNADKRTH